VHRPLVKYQHYIGGANYVSVTSGFKYVDFRTFFIPYGGVEPKTGEERHRAAHSRMDRITASGRRHQQHVPRPCYSPTLLDGTRSRKPDVGPEVFRMLPVRRYRYYLTRLWLNWLRSVTFDCLE